MTEFEINGIVRWMSGSYGADSAIQRRADHKDLRKLRRIRFVLLPSPRECVRKFLDGP